MAEKKTVRCPDGVAVSTAISAGGMDPQHCEGIVVSTAIAAGGTARQPCEAVVRRG